VSFASIILALVTLQRLGELVLAQYNTKKLLARGAIEAGAAHYPLVVAVHALWLIALWVYGRNQEVNLPALAAYVTTRIIVLPGEPLIASGPYRYFSHPNYAVVVGEIALLPLTLHLPMLALVFSLLNAAVLTIRIRTEARVLDELGRWPARAAP
jgi:methyltransferase